MLRKIAAALMLMWQTVYTPPPYLLYANVNGVPTAVQSTATTGQLNYQPYAVLAKCMNGNTVVDCSFSGGASAPASASSVKTGTASNTDTAGVVTLAAGQTSTPPVTFTGMYAIAPVCQFFTQNATVTQAASIGIMATQTSTTGAYATVSTSPQTSLSIGYICVGRN